MAKSAKSAKRVEVTLKGQVLVKGLCPFQRCFLNSDTNTDLLNVRAASSVPF